MKSPGNFLHELQGRRGGVDDRLDQNAWHQQFGGKFIRLALDFFRSVAPVSDIGLRADEFHLVVTGAEEFSRSERKASAEPSGAHRGEEFETPAVTKARAGLLPSLGTSQICAFRLSPAAIGVSTT
jgi:hypothetical protein